MPGRYGGFETLAENLVHFHASHDVDSVLCVYCSAKAFDAQPEHFRTAALRYINFDANGPQSMLYDTLSLIDALRRGTDVILLLGVSGALALPFVRAFSRSLIVTNIDGIEWKRDKWSWVARRILKWSEWAAVRWSHFVIADNDAIAMHVRDSYTRDCHVIPYGGDHAISAVPEPDSALRLPKEYVLALCRIEPENNVAMILESFVQLPGSNLVFVGNWNSSVFGRELRAKYSDHANLHLIDPIYSPGRLRWVRDGAEAYVHGHSAGGTNPSLVEMMHFGIPMLAFDCLFNRYTTEGKAKYFSSTDELVRLLLEPKAESLEKIGCQMKEIALRRYSWKTIGRAYFDLCETATRAR